MPLICVAVQGGLENSGNGKPLKIASQRKQLSSVSTALLLALGLGMFEALALYLGSGTFLHLIGVSAVCYHLNTVFLIIDAAPYPYIYCTWLNEGYFYS